LYCIVLSTVGLLTEAQHLCSRSRWAKFQAILKLDTPSRLRLVDGIIEANTGVAIQPNGG
jgi:hypothetical protein